MNNKKISIAAAATGLFMVGTAFAQTAEIGTWAGFRKGAASFTFDDGAPSHVTDAGPMFKKYGYKATFNLVVTGTPTGADSRVWPTKGTKSQATAIATGKT